MTPQEFTQWLDGFLSLNPNLTELNEEQTRRLKDKLSTVFNKQTPNLNLKNNEFDLGTKFKPFDYNVMITC